MEASPSANGKRFVGREYETLRLHGYSERWPSAIEKLAPTHEGARKDIDDIRSIADTQDAFYRSGDVQVMFGGQEVLMLTAVPEPESFRQAIVNSVRAWGGAGHLKDPFVPAN